MKKIIVLLLFIFIGCLLAAGFLGGKFQIVTTSTAQPPPAAPPSSSTEVRNETLEVSIGNYHAVLPVYLDNTSVGEVAPGASLNISASEGHHAVKVCDGSTCEQIDVQIKSGIKTAVDFGERLIRDITKGSISVSIGNYNAVLPVYLDNTSIGNVSMRKPLNISFKQGLYTVRVCSGTVCEQQVVDITSENQTVVDFGERLVKDVLQGPLIVSLGGFNADHVPVFIDNITVGEVSYGNPLNMMVKEGRHIVKACVDTTCENTTVDIRFGQPSHVDFGELFKKDIEFLKPTVRIISSFKSNYMYTVNTEFINPDTIDHTMTVIIGCGYSYVDYSSTQRQNEFSQVQVSKFVKAGDRQISRDIMYLDKGSFQFALSEPSIVDMKIE